MKTCHSCQIKVGGNQTHCPLCQNELFGQDEFPLWPYHPKMPKPSFLYNLQLFLALSSIIITMTMDFMLNLHKTKHWSLMVLLWVIGAELMLRWIMKRRKRPVLYVAYFSIMLCLLVGLSSFFFGYWRICKLWIMPSICMIALLFNFIFSMTDKKHNAMVFLLCNIVISFVPTLAMLVTEGQAPLFWTISFMEAAITFLGLVIFKGKLVLLEIQKRFNV